MNMLSKRRFGALKRFHEDESAPNTVEWIMLVVVALIVMVAIYFIAQWALSGGQDEAKKVDSGQKEASKTADEFKSLTNP